MSTAIDIKGLSVYFGDSHNLFQAVKGATFSVQSGASFGLVGESGSGKSTILKAITGLAPYWEGEMTIAGQSLAGKRDQAFYKTVQMVFQDPYASLHPRQSVDQVLSETLRLHGFKDINDRVDQLLKDVGLGVAFRFRYPHQLSGGQRQRIAIARSLLSEPGILILDEATSALDDHSQALIQKNMDEIRKGRTVIVIAHRLSTVRDCDCIHVLDQGRIIESGTHDTLIRNPDGAYRNLWNLQKNELAIEGQNPKAAEAALAKGEADGLIV